MMGGMASTAAPGEGDRHAGTRVFCSSPDAPSAGRLIRQFDELAGRVYVGLRDNALHPESTFDLACFLMDWGPGSPAAHELAEQSVAETDRARLADLARLVLAESGFKPGFDVEPRLRAELERALEAVRADMRATGLAGAAELDFAVHGDPRQVFARFEDAFGFTSGMAPGDAGSQTRALVAVADDLQDAVMGRLSSVWPVCPQHSLGGHPEEREAQAVWWCAGGGGHAVARIGEWPG